ncbi:hypothetical protein [Bosea sp. PAMC 26642]|uniref:hypothetical protein n=1 Tax=Bosea sp. (strain PAMC 26642) TaxID=1792307 RepID=UPI0007703C8E|nr:hypothetical protein [Bosea sp. PAMC 26642]AMJ59973.1 hypothetical protein AXW83_06385 [Bosea sp. PAMC 26642]
MADTPPAAGKLDPNGRFSVSADEWFALAEEALAALAGVQQKRRGKILEDLSSRFGPHPTHIRRAAKAGAFLRVLASSEPILAKALQKQSFQAVEIIERWYRSDTRGARRAARRLLNGDYSIASLAADQRNRTVLQVDLDDALDEQLVASFSRQASQLAHKILGPLSNVQARPPGLGLGSLVDQIVRDDGDKAYAIFLAERLTSASELAIRDSLLIGDILKCIALNITPVIAHDKDRNMGPLRDMFRSFGIAETKAVFVAVDFTPRLATLEIAGD